MPAGRRKEREEERTNPDLVDVLSSFSDDDGRVLGDDQASHLNLLRSSLSAVVEERWKREGGTG